VRSGIYIKYVNPTKSILKEKGIGTAHRYQMSFRLKRGVLQTIWFVMNKSKRLKTKNGKAFKLKFITLKITV